MSKGTILIIEDNQLNLDMARDLLRNGGFQILEAEDADSGFRLAKAQHPDLILMDMYLPGRTGYEACQMIKSDLDTQDIPVVAFTALAMDTEREKAKEVGCSGVISKPIDVDHFAETVAGYLGVTVSPLVSPPKDLYPQKSSQDIQEWLMKFSHDFQAPIRKISQFSGFLKESALAKLSPEEADYLYRIEQSAHQLQDTFTKALSSLE